MFVTAKIINRRLYEEEKKKTPAYSQMVPGANFYYRTFIDAHI